MYKRDDKVKGLDVHVYFWDDRDGPQFCGWYFGMKVGGDEVWAYHPDKAALSPPSSGWQVPFGGAVDANFAVQPKWPPSGREPKVSANKSSERSQGQGQVSGRQSQRQQQKSQAQAAESSKSQPVQQQSPHVQQQPQGQPQPQPQPVQPPQWDPYGPQAVPHWQAAPPHQMMHWQLAQQQQQQQQLAEARKKQDDDRRKRQNEERRKREDEMRQRAKEAAAKKDEEQAVHTIMQVIQKVRVATPESFPELKKQLEETVQKEADKARNQGPRMRDEAEKAMQMAQKCVDMIMERRKQAEEKRAAEERRQRELEDRAQALLGELKGFVETAEGLAQTMIETASPFFGNVLPSVVNGSGTDGVWESTQPEQQSGHPDAPQTALCDEGFGNVDPTPQEPLSVHTTQEQQDQQLPSQVGLDQPSQEGPPQDAQPLQQPVPAQSPQEAAESQQAQVVVQSAAISVVAATAAQPRPSSEARWSFADLRAREELPDLSDSEILATAERVEGCSTAAERMTRGGDRPSLHFEVIAAADR